VPRAFNSSPKIAGSGYEIGHDFFYSNFFSLGMADCILVNSNFTAQTFLNTFTSLSNTTPRVLYPSLNFKSYDAEIATSENIERIPSTANRVFLSINRFERKKNLQLALKAFGKLKSKISEKEWKATHLVIAGMIVISSICTSKYIQQSNLLRNSTVEGCKLGKYASSLHFRIELYITFS
jgi:glycosyltransferase involved in cell wall biosynthesis